MYPEKIGRIKMKNWLVYLIDIQSVPSIIQATNDTHTNIIRLDRYEIGVNRYDIECVDIKRVWEEEKTLINRLKRAFELKQSSTNAIWLDECIQTAVSQNHLSNNQ